MPSIRIANLKRNRIFFCIIILMIIILLDTSLIKFYDLIDKRAIPIMIKKIIFSSIAFTMLILQFAVATYIRSLSKKQRQNTKLKLEKFENILKLSLLTLMVIFSSMIFEMFYFNYYHTILLVLIVLITYATGSIFVGRNLLLFISWFRLKHDLVFGLYILSMSMIIFNLVMTAIIVSVSLGDRPLEIREFAGGTMSISAGKYNTISILFRVSAVLSFVSIWITTVSLMRASRDQIIGKVLYWTILIIPLAYFLISNFAQDILSGVLAPSLKSDPIFISLIFTPIFVLSKPVGGVIFGILFWRISKLVSFDKLLREYMILSGYGFLLLFSANQSSSLVLAPYPPFGSVTIAVLVLATYLIFIGIYRSSTMVSVNVELRRSIFRIAKESKLLNIIGRTEMEKRIKNSVTTIVAQMDHSSPDTPSFELDEEELKGYVEKVIDHLKNKK